MRRTTSATLLLVAVLLAGLVAAAEAAKDDVVLVSRASGLAGAAANNNSFEPSISADGRFVAFNSGADNLSDADADVNDVFVRDLLTGTTSLVSRVSGAAGAGGDADSVQHEISDDGGSVAFDSLADNLSGEDDDSVRDVFVRDLETTVTTFASRASGTSGAAGDGASNNPSISADGRFVAFESDADTLSSEDNDLVADVFVRDLQTGTTVFVSRATGAAGAAGDGTSFEPSISADGRFVAFESSADNLSTEDDDTVQDVFVRDMQTGTTIYVSRATGAAGAAGDGLSQEPSISGDGRLVAFESAANSLSADDNDPISDVFVRDLQTNATTYVSRASGVGGTAAADSSRAAAISADGRFVGFHSFADNLSAEDDGAFLNVFVRDLTTDATTFVSRAPGAAGAAANDSSAFPSLSGDGRFVAFESGANNLSGEDEDGVQNIFVRDVLGPPPVPPSPAPVLPTPPGDAADGSGPGILGALSRVNGTVRVSSSGRFTLFCGRYSEPVTGRCGAQSAGTVSAAQRGRRLRVGARRFTAAAGRRALVRFRLSRRNLRRLRAARRVRMRGTVVARDSLGNPTTARFRFTLKAPVR